MGILSGKKADIGTSAGLTQVAEQAGLGERARQIMATKGEKSREIFSGGFISDIFDSLNAFQYGVVGVLKGKGFAEGVKTRQSFADQDALGGKGIVGTIGGIALDIAVDPLTYIAPWTVLKKVGATRKLAKAVKWTEQTKAGKYLGDKFIYMFGKDPIYREAWERSVRNIQIGNQNLAKMSKDIVELLPETAKKIITRDKTGRIKRVGLKGLRKTLTSDEFNKVSVAWNKLDNLGKEAVDVGLLSKGKYEENLGEYMKNAYTEYEKKKGLGVFGALKKKVSKQFGRKEGLTPEQMVKLGQIDNPAYLLFKSGFDLTKDIENAKFFKAINAKFGSTVAKEGFKQMSTTQRFVTSAGKQAEVFSGIKDINLKLKPLFKGLKQTFKSDKNVLSEIHNAEKQLVELSGKRAGELTKFFQEGQKVSKVIPSKTIIRGVGKLPDELVGIGESVKKFKNYDDLMKSDIGLSLERLDASGKLERLGFKSTSGFFDYVKNPYKKIAETTKESIINNKVTRLNEMLSSLGKKKSIEEIKQSLFKIASKKEDEISKSLQSILDIPGVGKNTYLDLQKIGIKTIDDLVDVKKTGVFLKDDTFDTLGKIRKYLGKSAEGAVRKAERIVAQNEIINEIIPKLQKFKNKDEIIKEIKSQIQKTSRKIRVEETKNLSKIVKLQKQVEGLITKSGKLKEIDKRSIDDAFRYLEENISTLTGKKEEFIEQLGVIKLGDLSGKWVPEDIFNSLTELTKPIERGAGEAIMGEFKKFKTIMNPATHARNMISNQLLNWWKLGIGPWRQDLYLEALGQMRKGGKWIDEAKTVGYGLDTFMANEIRDTIISPEGKNAIGKLYAKIGNKLGDIYQSEENVAKLTAFIFKRKQGLGIEEAWKVAETATFNYAQVTPFVRKLRTAIWGYPFITFSIKSAPVAVETALKAPQRISVLGKIKGAIESMSDTKETERERANEPAWIRDGFYIKLPMKDSQGRSGYFDLTYIVPFGDLVSGGLFTRQVSRETGLPESMAETFLEKSPFLNVVKELGRNQDFYGDKVWRDSDSQDKQLGDMFRYLTKTYLPPAISDQIPGGWKTDSTRRIKGIAGGITATSENQQRTLMQEILRNVGMKVQPIDADMQETYMEWEKKKAMETLLIERQKETGFKKFEKGYITK